MKFNWQEYKERNEAKRYFRQNNDQFLSSEQWIKTIGAGLLGAIVLGVIHGAITMKLEMDFSLFYIVIGYAVANILTSVSKVSSPQIGIASAILTFVSFYFSHVASLYIMNSMIGFQVLSFGNILYYAAQSFMYNDLLDWIFIIIGVFVAYQQGQ